MSNAALVHILDSWAFSPAGDPDSALLGRFLSDRDEDAFAALVRRHGPLVYGTCRRVLGNGADADDAFQAVFFVLARRADALKRDRSIGPWLHGVSLRVAIKSRTRIVQRRLREMSAAKSEQAQVADPQHEFWAVIDEELARLPVALREAVLLCDLGGQSHARAAESLGLAKGTVTKRLARAHAELADRLRRRGITLGAAALSAVIAAPAAASVPVPLLSATAKHAVAFSTGPVAGSTAAHALAEGVMRSLKVGATKAWLGLALLAVSLAGGGLLLAGGPGERPGAQKAEPPAAARGTSPDAPGTPVKQPQPKAKDDTITLAEKVTWVRWSRDGATMVSVTTTPTDGRRFRFWDGNGKLRHDLGDAEYPGYQSFELSPDGKLMGVAQRHRVEIGDTIELWDVGTGRLLRTVELDYGRSRLWFTFSPDGSTLAVCGADIQADKLVGTVRLYDTATGKLTSKFSPGKMSLVIAVAFSPDGKLLAAGGSDAGVVVWDPARKKAVMTGDGSKAPGLVFSGDGKTLAVTARDESGVTLWDVATGQSRVLKGDSTGGERLGFSPDGRYVGAVGTVRSGDKDVNGLRVWDATSGEVLHELADRGWRGFHFAPDGKRLTVVRDETTIEHVALRPAAPPAQAQPLAAEPAYRTKAPRYGRLALGPKAEQTVWVVIDGEDLYVDRNGNGDLTEDGERVTRQPAVKGSGFEVASLAVGAKDAYTNLIFYWSRPGIGRPARDVPVEVLVEVEKRYVQYGHFKPTAAPKDSPVLHFGGPLEVILLGSTFPKEDGKEFELRAVIGTRSPTGQLASVRHDRKPAPGADAHPVAEVVFPAKNVPGAGGPGKPERVTVALDQRCCNIQFNGTARVPAGADPTRATVTLSYPAWKDVTVRTTTELAPEAPEKAAPAADLTKIERKIGKEPAYQSKAPRYCLLVFGPTADHRVWLVLDGDTLYVDRNGNGDLTEAGESTKPAQRDTDPCHFVPVTITAPDGKTKGELRFDLSGWFDYSEGKESADLNPRVTVTWKGRTFGSWGDETGPSVWGRKPQEALILHIDGPLQMGFEQDARFSLVAKGDGRFNLYVGVGTKGLGKGSFVHLCDYDDAIPKDVHPTAVLEFPNKTPGGAPVQVRAVLKKRESSCRLYDTIQVEGAAAEGTVKIALAFDEWKAGKVAPATFELPIPAPRGK